MVRATYIERIRRIIYNGPPNDDASITRGMVNNLLSDAIAIAAKTNYIDNEKIDGISYVNNSFYTTFKGLTVTQDEQFLWRIELPQLPVGIGYTEGISKLQFKDSQSQQISQTVVLLSQNQTTYWQNLQPIPNKLMAYSQGKFVYVSSILLLSQYTANATMISGGDATDLNSELNVPPDYFPIMDEYLIKKLTFELNQPKDVTEDGVDTRITT